eukprot:CAMPEP_0114563314 /NCGR_PEP_ID=MMETSP0114-20121206/13038_1 /TAXON_ID=31324 /ORGANISM="Goniomonas sp, Strain m" /LENGTH=46 /DNA_ID= /DNA_START= /DNA_END= /DNA_ORIENTATION=
MTQREIDNSGLFIVTQLLPEEEGGADDSGVEMTLQAQLKELEQQRV